MRFRLYTLIMLSGVVVSACAAPSAAQDAMTYAADGSGQGPTKHDAREHAFRQALARILEDYDPVVRKGRDANLLNRLILAHPRVVIQKNFTVVREVDPRSNVLHRHWEVRLHVSLPASQIEKAWNEAQAFLKDFGRPTIALMIRDRIEDNRRSTWFTEHEEEATGDAKVDRKAEITRDADTTRETDTSMGHAHVHSGGSATGKSIPSAWYTETDSDVAQEMRQVLRDEGFNVIVISMAEVNRKKHIDMAKLTQADMTVLQELSNAHSADIFVAGMGRVLGPKQNERIVPGRVKYVWEADAKIKAYWTDNAEVIDSFNEDATGYDDGPDKGRITALKKVGRKVALPLMERIYRQLSIRAFEGRAVDLTFLNCSFAEGLKIEDGLKALLSDDQILSNQPANGVAIIRVQIKRQPTELAREILRIKFDGFKVEPTEGGRNTLRFRIGH